MAAIIGWAHSKFGKLEGEDLESLIAGTAADAIARCRHRPGRYRRDLCRQFRRLREAGLSRPRFALDADPALRFQPATRVENACATGSAAIHAGLNAIAARKSRFVLVVGAEKMTGAGEEVGDILLNASYRKEEGDTAGGFAGIFGRIAELYFQRYGDQSEALARIAAKNHRNGVDNPYAQLRKDLGFEFCNTVSRQEPARRRAAAPHRLLAGLRRRRGHRADRHGNGAALPKAVHIRAAAQSRISCRCRGATSSPSKAARWHGSKAHEAAGTSARRPRSGRDA